MQFCAPFQRGRARLRAFTHLSTPMKITIDLDCFGDEESAELSTFEEAIALAESDYKQFAFHVADLTLKELHAQLQQGSGLGS